MRVAKARAFKIRHRVALAPDDIIQHPEAEILQRRTNTENVVIGADHPQRPIRLENPATFRHPAARKSVIGGKAVKLIPGVSHRIDLAVVGPVQLTIKLQIVRGVGKNQINRVGRQSLQPLYAVTNQNFIERKSRGDR